ncbi:Mu-like prophage major head subunit gpT family protein [Anaerosinus gibii]|uniref:Mu-like prophage major head subunit gpT family protein n=1 Tax=Selenobaculum gibii TaxID=3054208 RepID=A0A9Y2AFD7_9FIRM|nr:Mu-like prophage major head subunit gpT family protein [Selenobaculum gbiensis]WIW70615.1 Mu-like prophage major head subunit gpT family protein [Selenobaculum gbiensis]
MLVSSNALAGIYTSFRVLFNKAFQGSQPKWQQIAMSVPSSAKEETYAWLGSFPRMREWVGDRTINKLLAHGYTVKNKDFEATVSISRNDIEDDTYGIYAPMIEEMGRSAAILPDDIIFTLLQKGFMEKCYDGKPYFDSNHSDDGRLKQSNLGTQKLSFESYAAARMKMMSLTDGAKKPLGIVPNLLVIPPQLEEKGRKILKASNFVDKVGENDVLVENIYKDSAELLVVPELASSPTAWFLLDTSRAIKPLVYQERKKPEFITINDPHSENVFMRKEYMYGVDARGNGGYGLWQLAFGSTGASA